MIKTEHKTIGTLVPVFSLQSVHIPASDQGTFAAGLPFLEWVKKTGQTAWQMLPLHETQLEIGSATKHVPSPYKSYGIGLSPQFLSSEFANKQPLAIELAQFITSQSSWLHDYALFCALRDHFKTDDWQTWDTDLRERNAKVIGEWTTRLQTDIDNHMLIQWQLHEAFKQMKDKADALDISLMGDLPYYVSHNSPLVWAHQDVFQIKDGKMTVVSGIPDTEGTHFGRQVWGHPLYRWDDKEKVISFWKMRLDYQSFLYNAIRFDHAKAFFAYGVMDLENPTNDVYADGPGEEVIKELIDYSHERGLHIFAEDSGDRTQELRNFLVAKHIPGLRIFWFALLKDTINNKYAEIANYPENCVAYTTTHDTEPLLAYLERLSSEKKETLAAASDVSYTPDNKALAKAFRDKVIASPAKTVIIPMQDWLLSTDRINVPGTEIEVDDPNWHYMIPMPIEDLPIDL